MKRPNFSLLLRILSAVAFSLVLYAVAVTVRSAVFNSDGGLESVVTFFLIIIMGHFAGNIFLKRVPVFAIKASVKKPVKFLSFMLNTKDAASALSSAVAWSLALLPVLLALAIYIRYGLLRTAYEQIVLITAYISGLKQSKQEYDRIMSVKKSYSSFVILALCLEFLNFFDGISHLKPWLLGISYFFILAYLLVRNQEDIKDNIFDKKHIEKSILPRNLRRINTFWVCILFLAVVLFFNLKPIVVFLLQLAIKISFYIMAAVGWLFNQLFQLKGGTQQNTGPDNPGFFGNNREIIRPFFNLLANTLRNATILYVAYRIIFSLAKRVPPLAKRLYELLKKLLSVRSGEVSPETTDYSDETERVKPARDHEQRNNLHKRVKRNSRALKEIKDPVEKVRYMYASILAMLPLIGVKALRSDTTADILNKVVAVPGILEELAPFTQVYNNVRYGERIPDSGTLAAAEGHYDRTVEAAGQK